MSIEISRQRILQLIHAKRVKGAYKTQKGWKIPLYGKTRMPRIIRGKRGRKGTWLVRRRTKPTVIHVNKGLIGSNSKREEKKPVIIVRKGSKTIYCSEVSFDGYCKIIYRPENETLYSGAKVWIEVNGDTKISMKSETIIIKKEVN
ncbi:hypothetical protein [Crocosphaera sp.]|uniref:hypothetical protein n=1 Tax=Crocosphaera sp. TaxID=2729996 RepID=UPI002631E84B|nr:hypothetical protein [Crocosphaera sp.]MDJ0583098.1 hypothetical protein [Crocosphaera sp.]